MEAITRTVYGSYLQTCELLGLPFRVFQNTTLNEKFNIQAGVAPGASELPVMNYFSVGNGGHRYITGPSGISVPEPVQHRATDAALYNHLPLVLRATDNDLSAAQRANYALRRQETHNGKSYFAYYLKRFNTDNVEASMEYRVVNNGVTVVSPFVPDNSNLNPTPPDLSNTGVNVVSGDYIASNAKFNLSLLEDDVAELLHVAEVIYDDEAFAIISEIALCTGVDKIVSVPSSTGNINFNEAIAVQVATFCNTHSALKFLNTGLSLNLSCGSTESILNIV